MDKQRQLKYVNKQIRQTKQEIEMHSRIMNQLELILANLEIQRIQLEDQMCIDVENEPEDNSIDQNKKFVLPNLNYRVPSDDEEEQVGITIKQEATLVQEDQITTNTSQIQSMVEVEQSMNQEPFDCFNSIEGNSTVVAEESISLSSNNSIPTSLLAIQEDPNAINTNQTSSYQNDQIVTSLIRNNNKHICHLCNKEFTTKWALNYHLKIHNGIKRASMSSL